MRSARIGKHNHRIDHEANNRDAPESDELRRSQEDLVQLEDQVLAAKLARGDHAAFALLVQRHSAAVFTIARRILRDVGEAEETVQQVFLEVFRDAAHFDPRKGSFWGWLKPRAVSRALDRRRSLSAQCFYDWQEIDERVVAELLETARQESSHLVAELMARVGPRERVVLTLTYYEGLTASQIAHKTGETLASVQHCLRRGLCALRAAAFGERDGSGVVRDKAEDTSIA